MEIIKNAHEDVGGGTSEETKVVVQGERLTVWILRMVWGLGKMVLKMETSRFLVWQLEERWRL